MSRTVMTRFGTSPLHALLLLMITALILTGSGLPLADPVRAADGDVTPTSEPAQEPTEPPATEASEEPAQPTPASFAFPEIPPGDAPPGVEILELRAEGSRTYRRADGSYVTDFYTAPLFYTDTRAGELLPIEPGFSETERDGVLVSDRAATMVEVRPGDDPAGFLSVGYDAWDVTYTLPSHAGPEPMPGIGPDGAYVEYHDVYPDGGDLRVFPNATGAKTFIVLPDGSQDRFAFYVDAPGLTLELRHDGAVGFVDATGMTQGIMPRPYLVDSSTDIAGLGSGQYSEDVALEVEPQAGDRWLLTIAVGRAFLETAVYPVYVDPTTVFPFDTGGSGDTFASQKNKTTNFNTYQRPDSPYYHEMWLGEAPGDEGYDNQVFIKFWGTDNLLAEAHIRDAQLRVMPYHQWTDDKNTWLRRVTSSWTPGTLTWADRPSTGSVATGDSTKLSTSGGSTAGFIVTGTVQKWVDGTWERHGFRLDENGNGYTYWKRLISANESGDSNVPRLRVVWHRPLVTPLSPIGGEVTGSRALSWAYDDDWSGGDPAQSHYEVKVATDSACSTVLPGADSGTTAGSTTTWSIPADVALAGGSTYHWCVRVKDGTGWSEWADASFTWDADALTVAIATPIDGGAVTGTVEVTGTAAGTGFIDYTLHYGPGCTPGGSLVDIGPNPYTTPVYSDTLGSWDTSTLAEGAYLLELTVDATSGPLVDSACVTVDHTAPVASLETPPLSAVDEIIGTADDVTFAGYTIEYAPGPGATDGFTSLPDLVPADTVPVPATDTLATWNTLASGTKPDLQGIFTLRLTVADAAGNETVVTGDTYVENSGRGLTGWAERIPVDLAAGWTATVAVASGEATVSRELFTIPSYGPPQQLAFAYSSLDPVDSGFGEGWSSNLTQYVEFADGLVVWHTADSALVPFTELSAGWAGLPFRYEELTHDATAGEYTIRLTDQSAFVFEDAGDGHLLRIEDRFGGALSLEWNAASATATDASGRSTTLELDPFSGRIYAVTDSAGRAWSFGYLADQLVWVIDPAGAETSLGYGPAGVGTIHLERTHDGLPQTLDWEIRYTAADRVEAIELPSANLAADIAYEQETRTVTLEPAKPDERVTKYTVSPDSLVETITDPVERATTLTYDEQRRVIEVEAPAPSEGAVRSGRTVTKYAYDAAGNLLSETAPSTATAASDTTYAYDANNDITSITRVGSGPTRTTDPVVTTYVYVDGEQVSMTEDAGGLDLVTAYTYTANHQLETETAPDGVVTRYEYDEHGNGVAMIANWVEGAPSTASQNVRTEYLHDQATPAGRAGLVTSGIGPLGRVTAYEHDPLGRITKTTRNHDPASTATDANLATETIFDEVGWVTATVDARGTVTRSITDTRGRVVERIEHCTDTGTTPSTSPDTCTGAGTHDAETNLVTRYTYDGAGNMTDEVVEGATHRVTRYTYDAAGRQTSMTIDPDGLASTTGFAYDEAGNQTATQDARGTITREHHDEAGNLTETIEQCTNTDFDIPEDWATCAGTGSSGAIWNRVTTYEYDELGRQVGEVAPNGRRTTMAYDELDRLVLRVENDVTGTPSGNEDLETTYVHDELGRVVAERAPVGNRTTFEVTATVYDRLGRAERTIERCTNAGTDVPLAGEACTGTGTQDVHTNLETIHTYDAVGNLLSTEMPSPSAPASGEGMLDTVITRYAYDGADRLCRVLENATVELGTLEDACSTPVTGTTSSDLSTSYRYDTAGDLVEMIDAAGQSQTYAYDRLGRMTGRTDGLGATVSWTYDEHGNRTGRIDRETAPDVAVTWEYDAADRTTSRTADGVPVTYTYDEVGGLLTASGPTGTITITRHPTGEPRAVTPDDGSAETTYSYGFVTQKRTDVSGAYTFTVDAFEREVSAKAPLNDIAFTFAWRPDGMRKQRTDPNGIRHSYSYTGGRLSSIVSTGSGCWGASCADIDYTYDRAGMRLSEASSIDGDAANGTATFAYDATGRLVAYGAPGSYDDGAYGWSEVLNREQTTTGTDTLSLLFDAADRPVSDSDGGTYTHDADGHMTAHPGGVLEWDSLGRLTAVRDEEGVLISAYTYDALDRLRDVTTGGVTTRHRYVGITTQVAQLRDVTNKASVRYFATSWSGELLAQWKTDTTGRRYLGTSGHGDITWAATNVGIVDATVRYDPWGVEIATSGQAPFFGFQGSWIDRSTGLYWVIARWYAPSLGAFISEDELLGEPDNPHSRHLYAYGWGDPVGNWDLDGLLVDRVLRTRATSRTVTRAREVQVREDLTIQGRYSIVRGNATWTVTASASGTKIVSSLHMRIVVPYGATCSNCVWITKAKATFLRSDFHVIKQVWPRRNRRCGASIDRPRPKAKVFHFCATSISLPKSATQVKFKWEFSMLQSGGTAQGHSGGALFRQKYRTGILAPKR